MDETMRDAILTGIVLCWIEDARDDFARLDKLNGMDRLTALRTAPGQIERADNMATEMGGWRAYWGM